MVIAPAERRLHANLGCTHTDETVMDMRLRHIAGDPRGVMQEIIRMRAERVVLNPWQATVVTLHELGAKYALGALTTSQFVNQVEPILVSVAESDPAGAADITMTRARLVAAHGLPREARELFGRFFEPYIPRTPVTEAQLDVAHSFLAASEGDDDLALQYCRGALPRCDRRQNPCLYEFVARRLAGLLVRRDDVDEAREVLLGADIPPSRVEVELSKMR